MELPEYYAGAHHLTPATRPYPTMFGSLVINNDGRLRLSNVDLLQLLKELFYVLPPNQQAAFLHHLFTTDLTKEAAAALNSLFDDCQLPPVATPAHDWSTDDQADEPPAAAGNRELPLAGQRGFISSREFFGFDQADEPPAPDLAELVKIGPVTQPRFIRSPQFDTTHSDAYRDITTARLVFEPRAEGPRGGLFTGAANG